MVQIATKRTVLKNALIALNDGMKVKSVLKNLNGFGLYLWEYRSKTSYGIWIGETVNEEDAPFSNIVVKPSRIGFRNLLVDLTN